MIKTLFFDVGYTLVDEESVWLRRCMEQAATEEAKKLGVTAEDIYHEIEKVTIEGLPQYRTTIERFNFSEMMPYHHELETMYEDAPQVLKALSEKYELGVIANQADGLRERLESFDILKYFKYVISSWDVKVMKPDIRIFEHALKTANCQPQDAVMIGDRIDNDTAPAQSLGMKGVWIKQGFGRLQTALAAANPPDYEVDNLTELLKIF
jgi:HAD superfamily hydrolase (TIGR01662 family)